MGRAQARRQGGEETPQWVAETNSSKWTSGALSEDAHRPGPRRFSPPAKGSLGSLKRSGESSHRSRSNSRTTARIRGRLQDGQGVALGLGDYPPDGTRTSPICKVRNS